MIVLDITDLIRVVQLLDENHSRIQSLLSSKLYFGKKVSSVHTEEYTKTFGEALRFCQEMQLNRPSVDLERFLNSPPANLTYGLLLSEIAIVRRSVLNELFTCLTIQIPTPEVKYYKDDPLFGEKVANKFPNAVTDIQEAGKCLALGRYTACVFHLMRVMELAVHYLGKKLNISLTQVKTWHKILVAVDEEIKNLPLKSNRQKTIHNRYAEASAQLRMVKDAWRNSVMHPKETYTPDEAERIFRNVKDFMVHLASKL